MLRRTGDGRKLCIVPSHNCHIYGTWRSKEVEGAFKVMIWEREGRQKTRWETFLWGELTLPDTM